MDAPIPFSCLKRQEGPIRFTHQGAFFPDIGQTFLFESVAAGILNSTLQYSDQLLDILVA